MVRWKLPAAAFALLFLAAGAWWLWQPSAGPRFEAMQLPSVGADFFSMEASDLARRGAGHVLVVRFAKPVEFAPYHYREPALGIESPLTIEQWAEKLNAPVVFNAGQFDENNNYLGWLKRDGVWLSKERKGAWKGLLVSGPLQGSVWARVIDLEGAEEGVESQFRHVVQSMMLLDAKHQVRVRDTDRSACRTVVAEDQQGRIILLVTEGATTLGDFARWLPKSGLGIVRAMNLDGGIESQLAIRSDNFGFTFYGQHGTGTTAWPKGPGQIKKPLPAVVAVRPL